MGKITKRTVIAAAPRASRYTIADGAVAGFGLRVFPSGHKSWIFEYRPGSGGRSVDTKRLTIGKASDFSPEQARREADRMRSLVKSGRDPQGEKIADRAGETVADVAASFLAKHVDAKRKPGTAAHYRDILERIVIPMIGKVKAKDLRRAVVSKLHLDLKRTPFQANRVMAVLSSMYVFAGREGLVPEGLNPARGIEKFEEKSRGRQIEPAQLERLGGAIREAETTGIPWELDPEKDARRHRKTERVTKIGEHAAAALRLLIFTGARLREILHLKWEHVDFGRGLLLLPIHKTSRQTGTKAIVLNAPALEVLASLTKVGVYVIAGDTAGQEGERPRSDLKKPWAMVTKRAGLEGLRLHDLRHNFASFGVGGGMGLPIVGKLLGHAQPATTARYSHLDSDPLRRASNTIAAAIAAAMGEPPAVNRSGNVVTIGKRAS